MIQCHVGGSAFVSLMERTHLIIRLEDGELALQELLDGGRQGKG